MVKSNGSSPGRFGWRMEGISGSDSVGSSSFPFRKNLIHTRYRLFYSCIVYLATTLLYVGDKCHGVSLLPGGSHADAKRPQHLSPADVGSRTTAQFIIRSSFARLVLRTFTGYSLICFGYADGIVIMARENWRCVTSSRETYNKAVVQHGRSKDKSC